MTYTIGLLMVNEEDDILERTLDHNAQYVDAFYVLDGTEDNTESERICRSHPKCWAYRRDQDLPRPPYPEGTTCGYRKFIHDLAVADHGPDNWFLVLHADEIWPDPKPLTRGATCDGWILPEPFFIPREGEEWDPDVHPLDQLHWMLGPGWPEFKMFKGSSGVSYDVSQHFNTMPSGLANIGTSDVPVLHYPYRSPEVQQARARLHQRTGFDPDNYRHILGGDVYWTDGMIRDYQARPQFRDLQSVLVAA